MHHTSREPGFISRKAVGRLGDRLRAVTPEHHPSEFRTVHTPARPSSATSFNMPNVSNPPAPTVKLHHPKPMRWNTPSTRWPSQPSKHGTIRNQTASVKLQQNTHSNLSPLSPRRSRSLSPSFFGIAEPSRAESPSLVGTAKPSRAEGLYGEHCVNVKSKGPVVSKGKRKEEKKKHGSFKIWHRNAAPELQEAYNAIYGLPLYGSVTFIGEKIAPSNFDEPEGESSQEDQEGGASERLEFDAVVQTNIVKRFNGVSSIHEILPNGWEVELESAGKDDGDFAIIKVNNTILGEGQRGINLVMIKPYEKPSQMISFDTHGLPEEAEKLSQTIKDAPIGTFFLGAIRDDGAKFLSRNGRNALCSIGVTVPKADDSDRLESVVDTLPVERTKVLLTVCAKANSALCARVLIRNGWDLETRASHTMNTPLHDAIYQRNTDVAIVLMDAGADPRLANKWGETPSDIALKKFGFNSIEDMIMQNDQSIQSVVRFIGIDGL